MSVHDEFKCKKCGGTCAIQNPEWETFWADYGKLWREAIRSGDRVTQLSLKKKMPGDDVPEEIDCPFCAGTGIKTMPECLEIAMERIKELEAAINRTSNNLSAHLNGE